MLFQMKGRPSSQGESRRWELSSSPGHWQRVVSERSTRASQVKCSRMTQNGCIQGALLQ